MTAVLLSTLALVSLAMVGMAGGVLLGGRPLTKSCAGQGCGSCESCPRTGGDQEPQPPDTRHGPVR